MSDDLSHRGWVTSHAPTVIGVESLGAVLDGTSHPLSERFASLAHARTFYPAAGSLADEIDWAAAQTAADQFLDGGTVEWPSGGHAVHNRPIVVKSNGLRFRGPGATVTVPQSATNTPTFEFGTAHPFKEGTHAWQPLTGSYDIGDTSVTLVSPAEGLTAGDPLWLRCRNLVSGSNFTPVAELNRVHSISGATIELLWPLSKEYADDGSNPFAVAKASPVERCAVTDLALVNHASRVTLSTGALLDFTMSRVHMTGRGANHLRGRHITVTDCTADLVPDYTAPIWRPYYLAVDTGTCDVTHHSNRYRSTGNGIFHVHEGIANMHSHDNTYAQGVTDVDGAEPWPVLSIRTQSWDLRFRDEQITNSPTAWAIDATESSVYTGSGHQRFSLDRVAVLGSVIDRSCHIGRYSSGWVRDCSFSAPATQTSLRVLSADFTVTGTDMSGGPSDITVVERAANNKTA